MFKIRMMFLSLIFTILSSISSLSLASEASSQIREEVMDIHYEMEGESEAVAKRVKERRIAKEKQELLRQTDPAGVFLRTIYEQISNDEQVQSKILNYLRKKDEKKIKIVGSDMNTGIWCKFVEWTSDPRFSAEEIISEFSRMPPKSQKMVIKTGPFKGWVLAAKTQLRFSIEWIILYPDLQVDIVLKKPFSCSIM